MWAKAWLVAAMVVWEDAAAQDESDPPALGACAADITSDGLVSTNDLLYLLASFGRLSEAHLAADVDGNGIVGTTDLLLLLASYGRSCGCDGAWSELTACTHNCGPDGTQQRTFSGEQCEVADSTVEVVSCNTDIMCPIRCEGVWDEWVASPCSLPCESKCIEAPCPCVSPLVFFLLSSSWHYHLSSTTCLQCDRRWRNTDAQLRHHITHATRWSLP